MTAEELSTLRLAFERQHGDAARALADLMLTGNATLERHGVLDQMMGERFEIFILACLKEQGLTFRQFSSAVAALGMLTSTIAELDRLPD